MNHNFSNQQLLAQHLNNSPLGVIEWDQDMQILFWSKQAENIFGWREEEVLNKHFSEFPLVHEADLPFVKQLANDFISGKIERYCGPNKNMRKDGTVIHCMWYSSVLKNINGKSVSVLSLVQDVTVNMTREEELKKSVERFNLITNSTNDGLWEWDVLHNKVWVNEAFIKTYGYNPADYPDYYDEWLRRIHPDDKEDFLQSIYGAQGRQEQTWSGEFRFRLADGSYGHTFQRVHFIYNEKCEVIKAVGIDLDITEQRKAENTLKENEKQLQLIYDSVGDVICLIDVIDKTEFRFVLVNHAFEKITGIPVEHVLGKRVEEVAPAAILENVLYYFTKAVNEGIPQQWEEVAPFPAGVKTGVVSIVPVCDAEGKCYRIVFSAHDTTQEHIAKDQLKENERQLRLIYDSVGDIIFLLDVVGNDEYKFISVNKAFSNATGIPVEAVEGKYVKEIIPEPSLSLVLGNYKKAIETKSTVQWEEVTPYPTGVKTGIVSVTPVYNEEGKCFRLVGSVQDVTEIKKAQEELSRAYEETRRLASHLQQIREQERMMIAQEIHDELGQTLTGLKMELSWLKKLDKLTPEQVHDRVQQVSFLLDESINTVRSIASQLRPSILDDLGLVEACKWQVQEFQRRSDLAVHFHSNADEIVLSKDAATAFFRVLQEALTNVLRHAHASHVNVQLRKEENKLHLSITDNGRGFSLQNSNNTYTLGLLGMKERMNAIGGVCHIRSTPGAGTSVEASAIL